MTEGSAPVLGGASGLIVRNGKVLLICRGKAPYKGHWSLPGGAVERGETIRQAVKREVREETGLDVDVGLVAGYREEFFPDGHYIILAFHCSEVGGQLEPGDDAAACEWVDLHDLGDRRTTPGLQDVLRDANVL